MIKAVASEMLIKMSATVLVTIVSLYIGRFIQGLFFSKHENKNVTILIGSITFIVLFLFAASIYDLFSGFYGTIDLVSLISTPVLAGAVFFFSWKARKKAKEQPPDSITSDEEEARQEEDPVIDNIDKDKFICTACGTTNTGWYQNCPACGAVGKMKNNEGVVHTNSTPSDHGGKF